MERRQSPSYGAPPSLARLSKAVHAAEAARAGGTAVSFALPEGLLRQAELHGTAALLAGWPAMLTGALLWPYIVIHVV